MTLREHLLTILAEECAEVAQRAHKAQRFGVLEVQEGQSLNNAERLSYELAQLAAMVEMLQADGVPIVIDQAVKDAKKAKVKEWLKYSAKRGTVDDAVWMLCDCGWCGLLWDCRAIKAGDLVSHWCPNCTRQPSKA